MRSRMIVFLLTWYVVLMTGHWWMPSNHDLVTLVHQISAFLQITTLINASLLLVLSLVLLLIVGKLVWFVVRACIDRLKLKVLWSLPACFLLAVILSFPLAYQAKNPLPQQFDGALVEISGVFCDLSSSIASLQPDHDSVQVFSFCTDTVHEPGQLNSYLKNQVIRLSCYYCETQFKPAGSYRLVVRLKFKRPLLNFHDYWSWQRQWRLPWIAKGSIREIISYKKSYVDEQKVLIQRHDETPAMPQPLSQTFRRLALNQLVGFRHGASIAALLFGDRSGLTKEQWSLLNNAGLSHLLVISGLHIGYIVVFLLFLTRYTFRFASRKLVVYSSFIIASGCLIFYLNVINYGLPALRASLVAGFTLSLAVFRVRMLPSGWWLAILLVCSLIDPFAFVSKGFWLSFLGVGILLALFANRPWQRFGKISGLWRAQVGFLVGFAGVLLWTFNQAPALSVISNMVAVPLISVILPLAMVAAVIGNIFEPFGLFLFQFVDGLFSGFWWIAELTSAVPVIRFEHTQPVFFGLLSVLVIPFLIHFRLPFAASIVPLVFLAMMFGLKRSDREVVLNLLDVGQGQALLLTSAVTASSDSEMLLYDAGPAFARWDAGDRVVLPAIAKHGSAGPDLAIASHDDNDHIGGLTTVLAMFPEIPVFSGQAGRISGARQCSPGPINILHSMQIKVLWPPQSSLQENATDPDPLPGQQRSFKTSDNNASCVVRIDIEDLSILIPGDIEADAQRTLLAQLQRRGRLDMLQADILILPHHGSQNSFYAEFLSRVRPRLVLVSAGHRNAFGHPHTIFSDWFKHRNIPLLNTGSNGAIEVRAIEDTELVASETPTQAVVSAQPKPSLKLSVRTAARPLSTLTIETTADRIGN